MLIDLYLLSTFEAWGTKFLENPKIIWALVLKWWCSKFHYPKTKNKYNSNTNYNVQKEKETTQRNKKTRRKPNRLDL